MTWFAIVYALTGELYAGPFRERSRAERLLDGLHRVSSEAGSLTVREWTR